MGSTELGNRLKQAREKAGLKQSEVCNAVEIPKVQTLSAYERGVNSPPIETLKKLILLYKVSSDWLLFGENSIHKMEKKPLDYVEQLVDSADHLHLDFYEWGDDYSQEKEIVLRLHSSPYDEMNSFVEKWCRFRELFDNNIIELDEYEGLMRQRINSLVLTEKIRKTIGEMSSDTEELPFFGTKEPF